MVAREPQRCGDTARPAVPPAVIRHGRPIEDRMRAHDLRDIAQGAQIEGENVLVGEMRANVQHQELG